MWAPSLRQTRGRQKYHPAAASCAAPSRHGEKQHRERSAEGFVSVSPEQEERPYHGSLLDPRTDGWVLEQSWPGLFDLYTRDGEARVELSPELNARKNALMRGRSIDDGDSARLERALFWAAVIDTGTEEGVGDSFGFDYLRRDLADDCAAVFGPIVKRIMEVKTKRQAELAALGIVNLAKRAAKGIVRMRFPGPARGNGSTTPKKALAAIWVARELCKEHRRLPNKAEVRQRLEAMGFDYSKSNGPEKRWDDLFAAAGLSGLPD